MTALCEVEGMRIHLVDDTEDHLTLTALGQHEEHLHILSRIKALGIHDGTATVGLTIDALTYLLILVGDNEELHRTSTAVHHLSRYREAVT